MCAWNYSLKIVGVDDKVPTARAVYMAFSDFFQSGNHKYSGSLLVSLAMPAEFENRRVGLLLFLP